MRIGFIAQPIDTLYPPVEGGSLAIWIYQVAKRCAALGHDTYVFANHGHPFRTASTESEQVQYLYTPTALNSLLNRLGGAGSSIRRRLWGQSSAVPEFGASWCNKGYGSAAGRQSRVLNCDVVHIMNYSQLAPVIRQEHSKAKICLHMECEWLTQLDREVIEERLSAVDVIIGCSEYITGTIADRYPEFAHRCVTVPNAATVVPEHNRDMTLPGYVLFVGRVSPEKGVHVLVEAFHRVLRDFPSATLHVAGGIGSAPYEYLVGLSDDPRVARLSLFYRTPASPGKDPYGEWLRQAAGEEWGKRIIFEGRADHSSVGDYYKRAAVLVNPSLSEAFGMSLVEAMMYRVPVIASRIGGMTNIVEHSQTGILVDAEDAESLAVAICEILADPARAGQMGDAGRNRALDRYSWDKTTALLLEYFHMALDGRPLN